MVGTGGHRESELSCAAQYARVASDNSLPRTGLGDGPHVGGTLISGTDMRCSRERGGEYRDTVIGRGRGADRGEPCDAVYGVVAFHVLVPQVWTG